MNDNSSNESSPYLDEIFNNDCTNTIEISNSNEEERSDITEISLVQKSMNNIFQFPLLEIGWIYFRLNITSIDPNFLNQENCIKLLQKGIIYFESGEHFSPNGEFSVLASLSACMNVLENPFISARSINFFPSFTHYFAELVSNLCNLPKPEQQDDNQTDLYKAYMPCIFESIAMITTFASNYKKILHINNDQEIMTNFIELMIHITPFISKDQSSQLAILSKCLTDIISSSKLSITQIMPIYSFFVNYLFDDSYVNIIIEAFYQLIKQNPQLYDLILSNNQHTLRIINLLSFDNVLIQSHCIELLLPIFSNNAISPFLISNNIIELLLNMLEQCSNYKLKFLLSYIISALDSLIFNDEGFIKAYPRIFFIDQLNSIKGVEFLIKVIDYLTHHDILIEANVLQRIILIEKYAITPGQDACICVPALKQISLLFSLGIIFDISDELEELLDDEDNVISNHAQILLNVIQKLQN